jgi:hypothetical protein
MNGVNFQGADTVVSRFLAPALMGSADAATLFRLMEQVTEAEIRAMTRTEAEAFVIASERAQAAIAARQSCAVEVVAGHADEQLQNDAHARQESRAFAREVAAGRGEEVTAPPVPPGPDLYGFVASMLAPALHCSTRTVAKRVEADQRLVNTCAATFAALWDGNLDRARADAVTDAARHLDPELWETFEALVLETTCHPLTGEVTLVSQAVKGLNRGELARRARRIARHLDPHSEQRAAKAATERRRVVVRPDRHEPGMAVWTAHLPSEVSRQMAAAVDTLAAQIARANPGQRMEVARADALAALVAGSADVTTTVELVVPVLPAGTSFGVAQGSLSELNPRTATLSPTAGEEPGAVAWFLPGVVEDPRHGVLLPETVAALLADPQTIIRLARMDPDGSIVQDPTAYRPSASTRRRVRARDGVCRFPGCATPAARSDTDHVKAYPHGPTWHTNLIALCRTHHLFKHHAGWTPTLAPDGAVTWAAPDGRTWTTHPRPHALREDLHLLDGVDPHTRHDLARGWLPGLPPGMSLADLARAEAELPDDPPDPYLDTGVSGAPHAPPDWQDLDHPVDQPLTPPVTPGSVLERACALRIAHALAA